MKLICALWSRRLARYAVLGMPIPLDSPLAAHIERCAHCRAVLQDFRRLDADLPRALTFSSLSASFAETLDSRLRAATAPRLRFPMTALAGAAASLALLGVLWFGPWDISKNDRIHGESMAKQPLTARNNLIEPAVRNRLSAPLRVPRGSGKGSAYSPALAVAPNRGAVAMASNPRGRVKPHPRRHLHRRLGSGTQLANRLHSRLPAQTKPNLTPAALSERWRKWGALCEANGDYYSASLAYRRAYNTQPDPAFAFDAGRTAESAGDVPEAIGYYAQLLDQHPGPQTQPDEGKTTAWTHDHGAV